MLWLPYNVTNAMAQLAITGLWTHLIAVHQAAVFREITELTWQVPRHQRTAPGAIPAAKATNLSIETV